MLKTNFLLGILLGIILSGAMYFWVQKKTDNSSKKENTSFFILKNQIHKMNKMVVVEQDFSMLQKTTVAYNILGKTVSDNQIMTFTTTHAQVSYDLSKMKITVDSIGKKLIITELPNADIKITPNVEIESIDDSFFHRVKDDQLREITAKAKTEAIKRVDKNQLRTEGRKQLLQNLNQIFVLAKALNYTIHDETHSIPQMEN